MAKKLLAVLLSVVMIASIITVMPLSVSAAVDYETFDNFGNKTWTGVTNGSLRQMQFTSGGPVTGVGGKSSTDQSISTSTGYLYFQYDFSGITSLEFNVYPINTSHSIVIQTEKNWSNFIKIMKTSEGDFGIYDGGTIIGGTMSPFNWYRIGLEFNFNTGKYTVYKDGVSVSTYDIPSTFTAGSIYNMRLNMSNAYLDDLKGYHDAYMVPDTTPYVVSAGSGVVVDQSTKTVMSLADISVDDIASKLSVTDGSFVGVADSSTGMTRLSGNIAEGDKITIVASDGVSYSSYNYEKIKAHIMDFDGDIGYDPSVKWNTLTNGAWIVRSNHVTELVGGLYGNGADDKALKLGDGNYSYYGLSYKLAPKATVEYSIYKTDNEPSFFGLNDTNNNVSFGVDNKIYKYNFETASYDETGYTYELGKWYRVAVEFDFTAKTYDAYVNGQKIVDDHPAAGLGFSNQYNYNYRFINNGYMDDLIISNAPYSESELPTLSNGEYHTIIDDMIAIPEPMTVEEAASKISANVVVVDPSTKLAKTDGDIEYGDIIAVSSEDGYMYNYYKVVDRVITDFDVIDFTAKVNGSAVKSSEIKSGDSVSFEYSIQNKTAEDKNGYLIFVAYEDDTMVYLDVQEVSVAAGTFAADNITASTADYQATATPDFIEAYFWNSMSDRTPEINAYKLK